ncbi:hypothetical protein PWP93_26575 [Paraburkholderia sp. A1RI-2L]|uniref:hypothetical protein n=1 Tax=Paraburkholderia sp. A1RI-2L TaxID=3028367 RepID=UPI003B7B9848
MCNEIKRGSDNRQLPDQKWTVKNVANRTIFLEFPKNFMRRHIALASKNGVDGQTKIANKASKRHILTLKSDGVKSFGYSSRSAAHNELRARYNGGATGAQHIIDCSITDINIVMTTLATKLAELDSGDWNRGDERSVPFTFEHACVKKADPTGATKSDYKPNLTALQNITIDVVKTNDNTFAFMHVGG